MMAGFLTGYFHLRQSNNIKEAGGREQSALEKGFPAFCTDTGIITNLPNLISLAFTVGSMIIKGNAVLI